MGGASCKNTKMGIVLLRTFALTYSMVPFVSPPSCLEVKEAT
jgi:hypothetical protein